MIFSLSTLIATPAKSEMIRVAATKNYDLIYYVNIDSITFDGNFVEASVNTKHKNPSIYRVSSVTERWKANCSYGSTMYIEAAYYDVGGKLISADRRPSGWRVLPLGSVDRGVHNFMCNRPRR